MNLKLVVKDAERHASEECLYVSPFRGVDTKYSICTLERLVH